MRERAQGKGVLVRILTLQQQLSHEITTANVPNGVLDRSSLGKGVGVGIVGMKERVKQLGGHLEIESSERGTQVTAVIPSHHFRRVKSAATAPGND
jgi:signal transduction histidine kinase